MPAIVPDIPKRPLRTQELPPKTPFQTIQALEKALRRSQINPQELAEARRLWQWQARLFSKDEETAPFLTSKIKAIHERKDFSWLKLIRKERLWSLERTAHHMNVSASTYTKLEQSEARGSISLQSLAKAAEAMDCELVYALRPKRKVLISDLLWEPLVLRALHHPWLKACDPKKKPQALAAVVNRWLETPSLRRKQGWVPRTKASANVGLV